MQATTAAIEARPSASVRRVVLGTRNARRPRMLPTQTSWMSSGRPVIARRRLEAGRFHAHCGGSPSLPRGGTPAGAATTFGFAGSAK